MEAKSPTRGLRARKPSGQVRKAIDQIHPSPENDALYRPVRPDDPEIEALAQSIREHGLKEPIVITQDDWILSGHRRRCAARLAGLSVVPVRVEPIRREDNIERFTLLLREFNRQREKSFDEKLREEIVSANPDEAYDALISEREDAARVPVAPMEMRKRRRSEITDVKQQMLDAVLRVLEELSEYLPVSERSVHYNLLSDPPLRNTASGLKYINDKRSSKDLSDLITRARAAGIISWDDISDDTRPSIKWRVHADARTFIRDSVDGFMKGYYRDLMVSQPNHIEILVEKNTVFSIVKKVAMEYCIPITSGRGNSSKAPLWQIVKRFKASGKEKLILLLLSDFDSDGISITDSVVGYMLNDFAAHGITEKTLHPVRMGLWKHQVEAMNNPPKSLEPNLRSSNYTRFVEEYGTDCWELEAIPPEQLQQIVREVIDSVIDVDAFNAEVAAERADAARLQATRNQLREVLLAQI